MKRLFIAFMVLLIAAPCYAKKVYKYTDPNGKTIYSDEPIEGAKEITLPKAQTYQSIPLANPGVEPKKAKADKKALPEYRVVIIEPDNDFVVNMGITELEVKIFVEPELQEYHFIQLFMDDKPYMAPQTDTLFKLSDLHRGTHTLKAKIVDRKQKNKVLKESESISVHVQRPMLPAGHPGRALSVTPFNQAPE